MRLTSGQLDFILKWLFIFSTRSNEWHWFSTSNNGREEVPYEKCMSDFLRHPDEDGNVYGKFGWRFPEYTEENFGVHLVDDDDEEDD